MKVFNLTSSVLDYRGKVINPGKYQEYDLTFIPDRDRALEQARVIAFDKLPYWFIAREADKRKVPKPVVTVPSESRKKKA